MRSWLRSPRLSSTTLSASPTTTGGLAPSVSSEWSDSERVAEYLSREIPHRDIAEEMLLSALHPQTTRFVDLGTGDGRLLALVRSRYSEAKGIGLASSAPRLDPAQERFN